MKKCRNLKYPSSYMVYFKIGIQYKIFHQMSGVSADFSKIMTVQNFQSQILKTRRRENEGVREIIKKKIGDLKFRVVIKKL